MYSVFIEDLEFYGHHGVSPEEQSVGHRFLVNVDVVVDGEVPESDDVADTVDYGRLAQAIVDVGTGHRFKTVEALAGAMCSAVLASFPRVRDAQIDLSKMMPPFGHVARSAGVRVLKSRGKTD